MVALRRSISCFLIAASLSCVGNEPPLDREASDQAQRGNLKPLKTLVANDSSAIHLRDSKKKRTALHHAAYWGDSVFVHELLAAGAKVDARDVDRNTPLIYAADRGHPAVVALLMERGADINSRDRVGDTPLHRAVFWGRMGTIRLLLSRGADPNIQGHLGWTALHIPCAEDRYPEASLIIARLLLDHGAIVNARSDEGFHPIHFAADGHRLICELLLEKGEVIDPNPEHHSPLNQAARSGFLEAAKLFVERGADVNRPDKDGNTSLDLAISSHRRSMRHDLDSVIVAPGKSPADYGPAEALSLIEYLVDHGAKIDTPNHDGYPPLHRTVKDAQIDVIRFLIVRGADVNQRDEVGWPPLHWAASRDNLEVIEILLDAGADVNARDLSGQTAIKMAFGDEDMKALLRARGAK